MPKIYDYNGDKMVIIQNEVVWNKKTQGNDFLYAVNFAIIEKIQGIAKFKFSLCTVIFTMIAKFRYDSEILLA